MVPGRSTVPSGQTAFSFGPREISKKSVDMKVYSLTLCLVSVAAVRGGRAVATGVGPECRHGIRLRGPRPGESVLVPQPTPGPETCPHPRRPLLYRYSTYPLHSSIILSTLSCLFSTIYYIILQKYSLSCLSENFQMNRPQNVNPK